MKYFLPIFLLFTLLPFGLYSQTFQVKVVGISDGDTFTGLNRDNLQLILLKGNSYRMQNRKTIFETLNENNK